MAKADTDRLVEEKGIIGASSERCVAGLIFTYRCTIRCRHCLFGCAADRPDKCMTPRQTADALALLHETGRVVHAAGGEAMMYWDTLAEGLRLAHAEGQAPHFIETNCSFAVDDALVADRLEFMAAHGVKGVLASADPYHQQMVPAERFLRVRRIARRTFGDRNFWGSGADDGAIRDLEAIGRDPARLREHVRAHPPVMVGAAHRELAGFRDRYAPDDPALPMAGWHGRPQGGNCLSQFQGGTLWELHVDPYGNIQTCCGMVLGRVESIRPAELLARGPEKANRFVEEVCRAGPVGLAELARREYGFVWPEQVSQGCELCYLARRHLRGSHPDIFGPAEIYD